MLGREISDLERDVLSLPIRLGGLGIGKPHEECQSEYTASKLLTTELTKAIVDQQEVYTASSNLTKSGKVMIKNLKNSELQAKFNAIAERCGTPSKRALPAAREKGASSWLNTLPLQQYGYTLNKEEFRDSVCLRNSWIPNTPITCGCGKTSDLDNLLTCKLGGYVIMTNNNIRDTLANLLREVCHDVKVEPQLQKVNVGDCLSHQAGDQARLDCIC